jgi:hypothetical protein
LLLKLLKADLVLDLVRDTHQIRLEKFQQQ